MRVFELVIALLFAGAVLSAAARRMRIPYPALVALAGAALALVPDVPRVTLDPELALTLFVAPVLLDAAFDASPRDLKQQWRAVASLALAAVALTVAVVAVVARRVLPELPWNVAIALGAIVAPPDAAAATAVLRPLRPPHRVMVILEGESLFNDASALLIYRLAVSATAVAGFSAYSAVPTLVLVCAASVVLGASLSRITLFLMQRIEDVAISVIVQFLSTFAVWMVAERLHLSGIITVVVYAIMVARTAPARMPARLRIPSYAVWEVAVFVLNVLAFILVGMQLRPILERLDRRELITYTSFAAVVSAAVVITRLTWVMGHTAVATWLRARKAPLPSVPARYGSMKSAIAIGWCGMRGTVTVAAALALPVEFPQRDLVLFTAFSVVLITLVVQGATLNPLLRALKLEDDGTVEREVELAQAETARAALTALERSENDALIELLARKYHSRLPDHDSEAAGASARAGLTAYADALRAAQAAERRTLLDLRARGVIGDDAFHEVEEQLDRAELHSETLQRGR
jgi:monovalent cation/hydrogen antiporter